MESTVELIKSSWANFSPGNSSRRVLRLKVGTLVRKLESVSLMPFMVKRNSSLGMDENGKNEDRHLVHFQSGAEGGHLGSNSGVIDLFRGL